jgi:hypothetical protein
MYNITVAESELLSLSAYLIIIFPSTNKSLFVFWSQSGFTDGSGRYGKSLIMINTFIIDLISLNLVWLSFLVILVNRAFLFDPFAARSRVFLPLDVILSKITALAFAI